MAPPPEESSRPKNTKSLSKLELDPTPLGLKAFNVRFPAYLAEAEEDRLTKALESGDFDPTGAAKKKLDESIYKDLISCIPATLDADMLLMTEECGHKGPKCLQWLNDRFNPTGTATSVKTIFQIFGDQIDEDDVVTGLNQKMSKNNSLPDDLRIPDKTLAALILLFRPQKFNNLKERAVHEDTLPTSLNLRVKVTNQIEYDNASETILAKSTNTAFAFVPQAVTSFCFNCDSTGHTSRECKQAKVQCDECNLTGHKTCLSTASFATIARCRAA